MARILSHVWSVARGSVGGITYFPNQFHQIVARHRTTPTNPNTTQQQNIRMGFDTAQEQWELLTEAARSVWNWYAQNTSFLGPLGSYTISGRTMFIRSYATALYLDIRGHMTVTPPLDIPPTSLGLPTFGPCQCRPLVAPGIGFEVVGQQPNAEDTTLYAFLAGPFEPTRLRYKGPFITASLSSDNAAQGVAYNIPFTGLVDEKVYFVKLRAIVDNAAAAHKLSTSQIIRCVASETAV